MNTTIKIGIVEDELIIAEKIRKILLAMEYDACDPVSSYDAALTMIVEEKPDLLLLDINLNDARDGIDLAARINETYELPFIFLTANSDRATIDRAKLVRPSAFLVKPFNKEELYAAIEIAVNTYTSRGNSAPVKVQTKDHLFIKENHRYIKIQFQDIVFVESCENYVFVHTRDKKKSIVRSTFSDFLSQLPSDSFFRTHRGFAVQLSFVEHIEPSEVSAAGMKIPVSASYRDTLMTALGIL